MSHYSSHKLVAVALCTTLVFAVLIPLDPALAKSGKLKNAQHGRGEALRGLLQKIQEEGIPPVTNKKQRLKEKTKLRNKLKDIGRKIRGENHSRVKKGS